MAASRILDRAGLYVCGEWRVWGCHWAFKLLRRNNFSSFKISISQTQYQFGLCLLFKRTYICMTNEIIMILLTFHTFQNLSHNSGEILPAALLSRPVVFLQAFYLFIKKNVNEKYSQYVKDAQIRSYSALPGKLNCDEETTTDVSYKSKFRGSRNDKYQFEISLSVSLSQSISIHV